jgi:hypothetical protein
MKQNGFPILVLIGLLVLVLMLARCSVQHDVSECKSKGAEYVSTGQLEGICVKDGLIVP